MDYIEIKGHHVRNLARVRKAYSITCDPETLLTLLENTMLEIQEILEGAGINWRLADETDNLE